MMWGQLRGKPQPSRKASLAWTAGAAMAATGAAMILSKVLGNENEMQDIAVRLGLGASCAAAPASLPAGAVMVSQSQTTIRSLPANSNSKSSFFVIWDNQTRNPLCTVEKLHRSDFPKGKSGNGEGDEESKNKVRPPFYPEPTIAAPFRVCRSIYLMTILGKPQCDPGN